MTGKPGVIRRLGLVQYLEGPAALVSRATIAGVTGLWSVRRGDFRESGQPHQLLVLSDITRPLREEELHAWQRPVRVLGHEINSALTPVRSLSSSLLTLVECEPLPDDWRDDVRSGLNTSGRASFASHVIAPVAVARTPRD